MPTNSTNEYGLNDAGEQRDVIPVNTLVTLEMSVKGGGAGDGWLTTAKSGNSEHLNCMFKVIDGPYAESKFWACLTLHGKTPGHEEAGQISRRTLKAILESARGIKPNDMSDEAKKVREIANWGEFDGIRFMAVVGVEPPKDGRAAKNTLMRVITPEQANWVKVDQVKVVSANGSGAAAAPSTPPAGAITRPDWGDRV
jgi:hypothetical protein